MEAVKVLIFGASGGIGTWAVHYALQNGHQVTAYVRHPEKMREDGGRLTVIQGELTDREKSRRHCWDRTLSSGVWAFP